MNTLKQRRFTFLPLFLLGFFLTGNQVYAQIDAIGQCTGVTTDQNYIIKIDGLTPTTPYVIKLSGSTVTTLPTGDLFATGEYLSAEQAFVDGTDTVKVEVIVDPLGTPDTTTFIVHEVLCTDVDGDGSFDFNTDVCDYTKPVGTGGAIVSTVAPYTGDNVYLYVLTDADSVYRTATSDYNNSGLFEDLANGTYEVFAFNFLTVAEANAFQAAIPDSTNLGTYTAGAPACYALCGSASYTVTCSSIVDIYVDPADFMVCMEGDAQFYIQDSFLVDPPPNTTLSYQWQEDSGSGWTNITDGTPPDSVLDLTNVAFADSGNMYRIIVTMTVDATTISMDTSAVATLTVYDDPVMASGLDVTVNSDQITGITFTVASGSVPADSFELVSVNTGGLIPGAGNASPGITGSPTYIFNDTYTNNTGGPDTAFYQVVPISAQGCRGDTITIFAAVRPCPELGDLASITICSGDITGLTLPAVDTNGLALDSFSITAVAGTNIGGTPTTGSTTSTAFLAGDSFTNTSDAVDSVVYTIVAYANDCASPSFDAVVYVDPEPVYADIDTDQCSDVPIGINLAFTDDSGLSIDSVTITAVVGSTLVGTATTGTGITTTDTIANDSFTNITTAVDSVVYTVTPYAGSCEGASYTITIRITPEPVGTDPTPMVCSDELISIDLSTLITNGGATPSFTWVATDNPNVSGEELTEQTTSTLVDQLSNTTNVNQVVVYTVTPTSTASCVGDPFTVTVTVKPEPVSTDQAHTVCSDEALDINLADSLQNTVSILGYTYTVTSSDQTNVPAGPDRTDTTTANITDTYTNTTNASVIITYTVTPISTDSCAGATFDVDVTVDPEPVLSASLDTTVCSDVPIGIILAVESGSVAADSFEIVSINNNGLTASAGNPTAPKTVTDVNEISDDAWTNETTGSVVVTYRVAPFTGGCRGDEVDILVTIDPTPVVEAGTATTICSSEDVDLTTIGASITGGASDGTWSTSGTGTFDNATFSIGTSYTPSEADKDAKTVTLTLTSDDPGTTCGAVLDTVVIDILDIRCSQFPWNGN